MNPSTSVITLTFGDAAENHVGMEMIGTRGSAGSGFTVAELRGLATSLPGGEEKYTRKVLVRKVLDVYTERMGEGRGILEQDELLFDPEMRAVLNIPANERLYIVNLSRYVSSCCLD